MYRLLALSVFLHFYNHLSAQRPALFDSLQVIHQDTVYFSPGDHQLDTFALKTIHSFPIHTNDNQRQIYLTAHTDAIGSVAYNEALAQRRAQSVSRILLDKGWKDELLTIQTYGERAPTATNESLSGRKKNRRVTIEIFENTPYMSIFKQVVDKDNQPVSNALVHIHNRTISDTLKTSNAGVVELLVPVNDIVAVDVYARGYFFSNEFIKASPQTPRLQKTTLNLAQVGAVADVKNLYFEPNQAILLPRSAPELPRVLRFMEINNSLTIEIAGHVNEPFKPKVGKDTFEWRLSVNRAKMVYEYLISNGIPSSRVTYKGYGNHEMHYPRARTDAEQRANRRVEIRVTGSLVE